MEYGLTDYCTLPRLDCTSVQSCCEVADIDFDGEKELLIGNSNAVSLIFRDTTIRNKEKKRINK